MIASEWTRSRDLCPFKIKDRQTDGPLDLLAHQNELDKKPVDSVYWKLSNSEAA